MRAVFKLANVIYLFAILALVSCSSSGVKPQDPSAEERDIDDTQRDVPVLLDPLHNSRNSSIKRSQAPVDKLIDDVAFYLSENKLERAAASAERAIRIAPRNARAYFALAQVRFYQAQYSLTRSLLHKARATADSRDLLAAIDRFMRRRELQ